MRHVDHQFESLQRPTPLPAQREAIEAPLGPVLVVAGPGAGKTFCLVERIRYLIEEKRLDPARILAFTFTNKAADEISTRLEDLGTQATRVRRGTLHAFCASVLRRFPREADLHSGFGIADEEYQDSVFRRIGVSRMFLSAFRRALSDFYLRDKPLGIADQRLEAKYRAYLATRNVVDFDMLVTRCAQLMERDALAQQVRDDFDYVLVDEFQDLTSTQFDIVSQLAAKHRNVFGVGDDEQSIYGWAGADPVVLRNFVARFENLITVQLTQNRRCARQIVEVARRLMTDHASLFPDARRTTTQRESPFPVTMQYFPNAEEEARWILEDIARDREATGMPWHEYAVLYRTHKQHGHLLESMFLLSAVPCKLARGKAIADDPVVSYVTAALAVIASPNDETQHELFARAVLPSDLIKDAENAVEQPGVHLPGAEPGRSPILRHLWKKAKGTRTPDAAIIKRAFYDIANLRVVGSRHRSLHGLTRELLSHRVGTYKSVLDDYHDELSDPIENAEVVALAASLRDAQQTGRPIRVDLPHGADIPLLAMLAAARHQPSPYPIPPLVLDQGTVPSLGLPTGLFKALQLNASRGFVNAFADFTALDTETTGTTVASSRIVEVAAVRVRNGTIVDRFSALVNPECQIPADATATHGITDDQVRAAPTFRDVWPALKRFVGRDVVVAHNGYHFDFPLLKTELARIGEDSLGLSTYDSLPLARALHPGSRKLTDLAAHFGLPAHEAHRALPDTEMLCHVFQALNERKVARSRKTASPHLLDHLGVALALHPPQVAEAERLFEIAQTASLGAYGSSLRHYESARKERGDESLPTYDQVVSLLGGASRMINLKKKRSAESRYPDAISRLDQLLLGIDQDLPLRDQIDALLQTIALSKRESNTAESDRVNLLTLHATKGLEFSRVYIAGVADEDFQLARASTTTSDEDLRTQFDEARRLLYVGMTRAKDRLVLTFAQKRKDRLCEGQDLLSLTGLARPLPTATAPADRA